MIKEDNKVSVFCILYHIIYTLFFQNVNFELNNWIEKYA